MEPENQTSRGKKENGSRRLPRFRRRDFLDAIFVSPWPWGLAFSAVLSALMTPGLGFQSVRYELGSIASVDIKAPDDFSYEDEITTQSRREEAAAQVLEVYDFNHRAGLLATSGIAEAFVLGREMLPETGKLSDTARGELFITVQEGLGVSLSERVFSFLLQEQFGLEVEQALTEAVRDVLTRDLMESKERLAASGRGIARRDERIATEHIIHDFSSILSLSEARRLREERVTL